MELGLVSMEGAVFCAILGIIKIYKLKSIETTDQKELIISTGLSRQQSRHYHFIIWIP